MKMDLTRSLTYIPKEVLVTEVLPHFSVIDIYNLCQVNTFFADICDSEDLWYNKFMIDFPDIERNDFGGSWKEYYKAIYTQGYPVYFNGDIIGKIYINPIDGKRLIYKIKELADLQGNINIVFINRQFDPIMVIKYPSETLEVLSTDYNSIHKVCHKIF